MDLASLIGLVGATIVVLAGALMGGSLLMYWDLPSLLIVIVGGFFVVMARWPLSVFISAMKAAIKVILYKADSPEELIKVIIGLSTEARKGSLLALEKVQIENRFLAKAVRFMVDGFEADTINSILNLDMAQMAMRHKDNREVWKNLAESAPALGMIGTVLGLVVIMADLTDPNKIGPGLAVALITTLYGGAAANMYFTPISQKLKYRSEEEVNSLRLIKAGVNGIIAGENPRTLEEKLQSFLPPSAIPPKS